MATQTKVSSLTKPSAQKNKHPHIGAMQREQDVASRSLAHYIPEKWRDPVAILFIFLSLIFFFRGVLDSTHVFSAGDNIAFDALRPFISSAQAEGLFHAAMDTEYLLRNAGILRAASVTGDRTYDLLHQIFTVVQNVVSSASPNEDAMAHIWHYFIFRTGVYLLMRVTRNTSRIVALFAAFSAIFSTWIITYIMNGHNTKIYAVMAFPYIIMAIERLRAQRMDWQAIIFWCAVLATSIHILLESIHMQMIFYIACAVLIYFLTSLVVEFTRKSEHPRSHHIGPLVRSGVLTLLMGGIAFCMSADRYLSSLAYEPYSIRGQAPIQDVQNTAAQNTRHSVNDATTSSGIWFGLELCNGVVVLTAGNYYFYHSRLLWLWQNALYRYGVEYPRRRAHPNLLGTNEWHRCRKLHGYRSISACYCGNLYLVEARPACATAHYYYDLCDIALVWRELVDLVQANV